MNAYSKNAIKLPTTKMAQKYFKISNPRLEWNNIFILSKEQKCKSVCTNNMYFQRPQETSKVKTTFHQYKFLITISIIYLESA